MSERQYELENHIADKSGSIGRQHDVSECMDNCMFQIETALLRFGEMVGADVEKTSVVKRYVPTHYWLKLRLTKHCLLACSTASSASGLQPSALHPGPHARPSTRNKIHSHIFRSTCRTRATTCTMASACTLMIQSSSRESLLGWRSRSLTFRLCCKSNSRFVPGLFCEVWMADEWSRGSSSIARR